MSHDGCDFHYCKFNVRGLCVNADERADLCPLNNAISAYERVDLLKNVEENKGEENGENKTRNSS